MIIKNGITYIEKGGSEDNGTYTHYYYKDSILKTYTVLYNNTKGVLTTTTVVYVSYDTNETLLTDYFSWNIKAGTKVSAGVCTSASEEETILGYVVSGTDTDNVNGNSGDGTSGDGTSGNGSGSSDDSNSAYDGDELDGDNGYKDDSDNDSNLFDNSMSGDGNSASSSLPLGADVADAQIFDADVDLKESRNPEQTNLLNKGTTYPIIRINDHYFLDTEIQEFSMETGYYKNYTDYERAQMPLTGFVPTMHLIVTTPNKGLLKRNHIKQGDNCSVFFTSAHSLIKSMRCDFKITNVTTTEMDLNRNDAYVTYIINGELYVPDLYNEELRYNFNGSSRDAMMDAAKRLRLSFFFCDPDDTKDVMCWCNCKSPFYFILDLTTHAWKNADAFFESWIDPRYGLSFLNINRLLGEDGLDEVPDLTFWVNTFINNKAADGQNADMTPSEKAATKRPQAKIFTNIPSDDESATIYHINKWKMYNNAQAIQDLIGLNCKMQYESVNPGMTDNATAYNVEYSLCLNKTKFDPEKTDNDFYVLLGPGRNMTYASGAAAMGASETESSNKSNPEQVTNQLSDGDADLIGATDGNMMCSGNTHRFYEVAFEHNMRNLLLLQKQYIKLELNGANLTIVRGEKMPVMLMDLDKASKTIRTALAKTQMEELLFEAESGWYIIDGIEWVFSPKYGSGTGTSWRTNVKLVRREWPIPGKDNRKSDGTLNSTSKEQVIVLLGDGSTKKLAYCDALAEYGQSAATANDGVTPRILGSAVFNTDDGGITVTGTATSSSSTNSVNNEALEEQGTLYTASGTLTGTISSFSLDYQDQVVTKADTVDNSTLPLTGLKDYMKELYRTIAEVSNNQVKLVSARRWAVDENGNKVDGNAYIKKYDYYKCMNALGETMYFKKNNSRHLYGEAIDIINNGMDFTELMTNIIMKNGTILLIMYDNGVSAYIEKSTDDMGTTTKHYHLGTDTIKQKEFWASVKAVLGSNTIPGTHITFTNYEIHNNKATQEIILNDVDELSLLTDTTSSTT